MNSHLISDIFGRVSLVPNKETKARLGIVGKNVMVALLKLLLIRRREIATMSSSV